VRIFDKPDVDPAHARRCATSASDRIASSGSGDNFHISRRIIRLTAGVISRGNRMTSGIKNAHAARCRSGRHEAEAKPRGNANYAG
jgi:hypothetical protein